jgi:hypothetical protein
MTKCGKSFMPECEYFTTGGCVSPFNCLYKIENESVTTATSTPCNLYPLETDKDKEISRLTAENAELRATLSKMETVEKELRARLKKAVELPFENLDKVFILAGEYTKAKQFIPDRIVEGTIVGFGYDIYEWADGNYKFNYHVLVDENNYIFALEQFNKTLLRLKELQGGER